MLNIFHVYYLVKSGKFGFITVRSSIENSLKFLERIIELQAFLCLSPEERI